MARQESDVTIVRNNGSDKAVVFVHGYSGARDDTWDRFPGYLGSATSEWDIFTIGYATTLLPDVVGVWSADPDLPILATLLRTQLSIPPFSRYRSFALIAHSMGGLVVQQALVEDEALARKTRHVILFGTPSGGLRKAGWGRFWKRQLKNMAEGSEFIRTLRSRWSSQYGNTPPFKLLVVAGASDQFVPPASSLQPFERSVHYVVNGDHVSIVKPANPSAPSIALVVTALQSGAPPQRDSASELRLAAERPSADVSRIVSRVEDVREMSVKEVVDAALALERAGKRDEAIALLERHKERDTDVKGTLAGRFKRLWMETGQPDYGLKARGLYEEALSSTENPDQIYYLAINVAFMRYTFEHDPRSAKEMAERALEHAFPPGNDVWKTATVAEAYLYLDRPSEALEEYRRLLTLEAEEWKHRSASLQAARIAAQRGDRDLAEKLEAIFTPAAKRVNHIFVSYSHKDIEWLNRLQAMVKPYLRAAETELVLWDDTQLRAGQRWDREIREALARAGVAVALVSADFLSSSYVMEHELPAMIESARRGGLTLLWVYISSAGWEETPLREFQATHDTKVPLDARPRHEQQEILKSVARQMKEAALSATERFKRPAV